MELVIGSLLDNDRHRLEIVQVHPTVTYKYQIKTTKTPSVWLVAGTSQTLAEFTDSISQFPNSYKLTEKEQAPMVFY